VSVSAKSIVATLVVLMATATVASSAMAATHGSVKTLIVYTTPKQRAFVNNADDRGRGIGNNPFGNYSTAAAATNSTDEKLLGPFPGDAGLFTYDLYSDSARKDHVGTGVTICQYLFDKTAYCDAQYTLNDGTLVGGGVLDADARAFSLQLTGGTSAYHGMTGSLSATLAGPRGIAPYLMLEPQRLAIAVQPAMAPEQKTSLYSLAVKEQFVDNGDDEARGYASNPFHIRNEALAASENEDKSGPYPGDEAVFTFKVYTDAALKKPAGTATFTCLYSFDQSAFCDAAYQLAGGTLIGGGSFTFGANTFTLAITGGTGKYAQLTGDLKATASAGRAQRLALTLAHRSVGIASAASRNPTVYSVATQEQFVNNEDDRARGKGNNPFGNYKDVNAATKEAGNGPFAGDEAIFSFKVYGTPSLGQGAGKATYICQYDFDKSAFCDVKYTLEGGTLLGAGEFSFNAPKFTIAITGGTGKYHDASGQLEVSPRAGHAQRVAFVLH
jgi:hypothetical protein